jgi:hypothetical protein
VFRISDSRSGHRADEETRTPSVDMASQPRTLRRPQYSEPTRRRAGVSGPVCSSFASRASARTGRSGDLQTSSG